MVKTVSLMYDDYIIDSAMTQFFIITQITLIALGLILLLYYSRMGGYLNMDAILDDKKPRVPRLVKIYAIALLLWLVFMVMNIVAAILSIVR